MIFPPLNCLIGYPRESLRASLDCFFFMQKLDWPSHHMYHSGNNNYNKNQVCYAWSHVRIMLGCM